MEKGEPFAVLIVDNDPNVRSGLAKGLVNEASFIDTASNAEEALQKFSKVKHSLVILDKWLNSSMTGVELMRQILQRRKQTAVMMLIAHGTTEMVVEAMRNGASDVIFQPTEINLIRQQIRRVREHYEVRLENSRLRQRLASCGELSNIITVGKAMQEVFQRIRQVGATDATVMIHGESGTGKELIARAIHDLSPRFDGPFVAVNLQAVPESSPGCELFGFEAGVFRSAERERKGCFEQAMGGTLFLDNVTELSPRIQVDLLRVLEANELMRLSGENIRKSHSRVISATNRTVEEILAEGSFREDLFYRLNVIPIQVPALRQRQDDIPLLVESFIEYFCKQHNRPKKRLTAKAMEILTLAPWPGNVRQLRNIVEMLVITGTSEIVHENELPLDLRAISQSSSMLPNSLAEAVDECEKVTIQAVLKAHNLHREKTAKALGISVRTLHYKMNRHGLH